MILLVDIIATIFVAFLFLIAICNVKQTDSCFRTNGIEWVIIAILFILAGLTFWAIWR